MQWVAPRPQTAALLLTAAALFASATAAAASIGTSDPVPDALSVFGESVSSLSQWPRSFAWGVSYRKTFTPYLAASLSYLNDGHFPGHHRDGIAAEAWVPFDLFAGRLTLSAGVGPFYYYDTVYARTNAGYADAHGWAWIGSVDAMIHPWVSGPLSHLFFDVRLDHSAPTKSIETTSIGGGIGYRGFSDLHSAVDANAIDGFADNEVLVSYGKTVVNSFHSPESRADSIEYRRKIWGELRGSLGFINEGNAQLIRRNGVTAEAWAEPSFDSGLWSIGAGFGFYSAIDKYHPSAGRHLSEIVSLTVSARPVTNVDVRFLWHRIVTDYNRDTDVVLLGLGYRF
jgi:hypothetical protein